MKTRTTLLLAAAAQLAVTAAQAGNIDIPIARGGVSLPGVSWQPNLGPLL